MDFRTKEHARICILGLLEGRCRILAGNWLLRQYGYWTEADPGPVPDNEIGSQVLATHYSAEDVCLPPLARRPRVEITETWTEDDGTLCARGIVDMPFRRIGPPAASLVAGPNALEPVHHIMVSIRCTPPTDLPTGDLALTSHDLTEDDDDRP